MALWDDREANTRRAIEVLDRAGVTDPQLRSWAQFAVLDIEFGDGRGLDVPALEAALVAERTGRAWRSDDQVATCRPALLKYADHLDAALTTLDELRAQAEAEGNVGQLIYVVGHYPMLLLRMGDLAAAEAATEEHLELATTTGQTNHLWQARHNQACVELFAGRLDAAAAAVDGMPGVLQADPYAQRAYRAVAGALALAQGDALGRRGAPRRMVDVLAGARRRPRDESRRTASTPRRWSRSGGTTTARRSSTRPRSPRGVPGGRRCSRWSRVAGRCCTRRAATWMRRSGRGRGGDPPRR